MILLAFNDFRLEALRRVRANPMNLKACRALHDALMLCFSIGWVPPVRVSCLVSLLLPDYQGPCTHRNCKNKQGCEGNRVYWLAGGKLEVIMPHHKVSKKLGGKAITFTFPPELEEMASVYLQIARPMLQYSGLEIGTFFITKQGKVFSESRWSQVWGKVFEREVDGSHSSPPKMRKVFVGGVREGQGVGTPNEGGAAAVMGNSVEQWNTTYDITWRDMMAQQAVDEMDAWRKGVMYGGEGGGGGPSSRPGPSSGVGRGGAAEAGPSTRPGRVTQGGGDTVGDLHLDQSSDDSDGWVSHSTTSGESDGCTTSDSDKESE